MGREHFFERQVGIGEGLLEEFALVEEAGTAQVLKNVCVFNHFLKSINVKNLLNLGVKLVVSYQIRLPHYPIH